ncbi:MAG: HAMP domain-containing histidine kinase [Bifidobacteriaceae bacterium]|jgi:two-component system sensor histidine kinase VanS|nr:HAMP domain-containing histidine kinase [Bifidobacteriaceae bacterium]
MVSGNRPKGVSARAKLAVSYAAVLVVAGLALLAVVWLFLLRYVPEYAITVQLPAPGGLGDGQSGGGLSRQLFIPGRGDLWKAFWPKAALAMAGLLTFGLVGGWLLAGRMLSPLRPIADAARAASAGSLSHRVDLAGPSDEFRELADAFDSMLARIEAQVGEQRRFAANASHELRTPLAVTQSLLDTAQLDPDRDVEQLIDRLRAVNARAIALTEALLTLSRAEQRPFLNEDVDLSLIAEQAAETLLPLAEEHDVTIELSGDAAWVTGSGALLSQLAVNLLHNAIVHNSPEGGTVQVVTCLDGGSAVLTVENTGVQISAQVAARLPEPFQRGAGRTGTGRAGAGAGLGLAIVRSITGAHNGDLVVSPRPAGGLRVTVSLPAWP